MKSITSIALCLLLASYSAFPQRPKFERYRVPVLKVKPKPLNIRSHRLARIYRSNLGLQIRTGVNFAGRFIVATIPCAPSCTHIAIVDAATGNAFFPEEFRGQSLQNWDQDIQFRKDSRLFGLNEYNNGDIFKE